jgi:hypothetical protein
LLGAKRDLANGTLPGSLATDLSLGTKLAGLCAILVLFRLLDSDGDVLVFVGMVEANFGQIYILGEGGHCICLHRPLAPSPVDKKCKNKESC